MKKMKHIGFLFMGIALCITACTSEKELANKFVEKFSMKSYNPTEKIYVSLPTSVIHTNQTLNQIENFLELDYDIQDSVIAAHTTILNTLDDKIFLQQFNDNLLYHLKRFGIPVVVVADPKDMPKAVANKIYTLQILQIEAEEFEKKSRSDFEDNTNNMYYYYDYDLKGFSTNVWYLINDTTSAADKKDVYFKNFETIEQFEGTINTIKNNVAHGKGKINKLTVNDAYSEAYKAGAITADKFCEMIINDFVKSMIKGLPSYYYYYNPVSKTVNPYDYQYYKDTDSFIKIEQ